MFYIKQILFYLLFRHIDFNKRKLIQHRHILFELDFIDIRLKHNQSGSMFGVLIGRKSLVERFIHFHFGGLDLNLEFLISVR